MILIKVLYSIVQRIKMTSLFYNGGTILYLRPDGGGGIQYSTDQSSWTTISSWPVTLTNTNTSLGWLQVQFSTDITFTSSNQYFACGSDYIQFGAAQISASSANRPTITVTAINYTGLIMNGEQSNNGYSNIRVYNLIVDGSGGTLKAGNTSDQGGGWVAHNYFSKGATQNFIVNCSSIGDIPDYCGGIVGRDSASVTLIGCSSVGDIGAEAGGIVGANANGTIVKECYTSGSISQDGAGGIVGSNTINATVENCYSSGIISGNNAGGIIGSNAGAGAVTITACYSLGSILGANAGGICGSFGAITGTTYTITITNCYTLGNLNNTFATLCGGISGPIILFGGSANVIISHCYTVGTTALASDYIIGNVSAINGFGSGYVLSNNYSEAGSLGGTAGTWSTNHANTTLTTGWISTTPNQPFELINMGYTPYILAIISNNALIRTYAATITKGQSSISAIVSGQSYAILSGNHASITINSTSGVISTTSSTPATTYAILIRNTTNSGGYSISTVNLTVVAPPAPPLTPVIQLPLRNGWRQFTFRVFAGNYLV